MYQTQNLVEIDNKRLFLSNNIGEVQLLVKYLSLLHINVSDLNNVILYFLINLTIIFRKIKYSIKTLILSYKGSRRVNKKVL